MHQSKKELPPPAATGCSRRLSALSIAAIIWPLNGLAAEPVQVAEPQEILGPPWLDGRREAQQKTAGEIGVFHEFRFSDEVEASGITFEHRIVDDAGRNWKPNHYDHGNGMAIADVDGDGRLDIYFVTQAGSNELYRNLGGRGSPLRKPVRTSPSPTASGLPPRLPTPTTTATPICS